MAILNVTHRDRALHRVPSEVEGEKWVYQIGNPLQLAPTECGIVLNIRRANILTGDLEIGNDLVILDRLDQISTERIVPMNRSDTRPNPRTGRPTLFARYSLVGGFVPFGAKRPDGSAHPTTLRAGIIASPMRCIGRWRPATGERVWMESICGTIT